MDAVRTEGFNQTFWSSLMIWLTYRGLNKAWLMAAAAVCPSSSTPAEWRRARGTWPTGRISRVVTGSLHMKCVLLHVEWVCLHLKGFPLHLKWFHSLFFIDAWSLTRFPIIYQCAISRISIEQTACVCSMYGFSRLLLWRKALMIHICM